jgi:hypothetical protein
VRENHYRLVHGEPGKTGESRGESADARSFQGLAPEDDSCEDLEDKRVQQRRSREKNQLVPEQDSIGAEQRLRTKVEEGIVQDNETNFVVKVEWKGAEERLRAQDEDPTRHHRAAKVEDSAARAINNGN